MNYGMGYGGAYVNEPVMVGPARPYYAQPVIVEPSPQVVVVDNGYNSAANDAACCCAACCCL